MPFPFIVVPTYHELENLPKFTERLWSAVPEARILLVDDASGDGAPDWVRAHPKYNPALFLLERSGKMGLGSAYLAGFAWVVQRHASEPCGAVVQMDADLVSRSRKRYRELLQALESGSDLVLATRYRDGVRVTNWPLHRLILSLGAGQYVKWITGMPFTDPTGGFKAFRPDKLASLDLSHIRSNGYAFQIEVTHMAWRLGWKIAEVPIVFEDRHAGVSKMSGHIVREAIWRVPWLALRGIGAPDKSKSASGNGESPAHEPDHCCLDAFSRTMPCSNLPPSRPERFQRSDFIAAGLVFLITLGVYVATLAPNVTLEDSGELITAAAKFGVGHPPGYPLWTLSGFLLSHVFPFGNLAWRINLMCALFGAAANAVLTLLVCHSGRWLLQRWTDVSLLEEVKRYVFYTGLLAGLSIGFSDVMWSQAVISAVHGTIQALILNLVLLLFYLWMLEPQKGRRLVLTVLVFALGLTNHHTLVQIIPAFLLAAAPDRSGSASCVQSDRRPFRTFFSVFVAVNLFSLSLLVYISWLSKR